jgi:hypothetical protein
VDLTFQIQPSQLGQRPPEAGGWTGRPVGQGRWSSQTQPRFGRAMSSRQDGSAKGA